MLTALHIEEHEGGFLRFLRHNRLRVEHFFCDTAAVKSITYEHWRGKLGWGAIDRFVKGQRGQLLCAKDTPLPPDSAYRRFESYELSRRMSENAALYLLREVGWDVNVALIDEDGSHAGLCEELVDRARLPVVYTKAAEFYIQQAEKLLREKGAAVKISRNPSCLRNADPSRWIADLPPSSSPGRSRLPPRTPRWCPTTISSFRTSSGSSSPTISTTITSPPPCIRSRTRTS